MPPFEDIPQNRPLDVDQAMAEAITLHSGGRFADAERLYLEVIKDHPRHSSALHRLGVLYFQKGRPRDSLPLLRRALQAKPLDPNILNMLAITSQQVGLDDDAAAYFHQACEINPTDVGILTNYGKCLREQKKVSSALNQFIAADQLDPGNPNILIEIGRCYYEMEEFAKAARSFETVLKIHPGNADAVAAMGAVSWALGQNPTARRHLSHALALSPNDARVVLNFGEFLAFEEGALDQSLPYFERALALEPDYTEAKWRKSFALLGLGRYLEGWKLYAECLGSRETRGFNKFAPMPPWDGSSAQNKHLLIWCEQGLGDSLQFIRYAALCHKHFSRVSIFCQKPLVRFFENLPYVDHASDTCHRGSFDDHIPLMNLPYVFETTLKTIPAAPYLSTDPALDLAWAAKFQKRSPGLRVGLVWAGGNHDHNMISKLTNRKRSMTLTHMKPWLGQEGITFFSLQKDGPARQLRELGLETQITDLMSNVTDFADTAAFMKQLDLIITVDTAVAHLAGGLGKPVWVMSRFNADWRWLQNSPSNPWYPSARVFGQPRPGDWETVIAEVGLALRLAADAHVSLRA